MNEFPWTNIHKLIAPDLLHQIVIGTFKDHLVTWVEEVLLNIHKMTKQKSNGFLMTLTDGEFKFHAWHISSLFISIWISIAIAPPFAGLRRFPDGRGFKQWMGDDLRALMKVKSLLTIE